MAPPLVVWVLVLIVGFPILVFGSQITIRNSIRLARALKVPGFLIGLTLISVGTDLPEIANSIIASLADHGDLNVGDSVGSVATQITLVLGLLPFIGGSYKLVTNRFLFVNLLTIAALGVGALLFYDGYLSRGDALILFTCWVASTIFFSTQKSVPPEEGSGLANKKFQYAVLAFTGLILVGLGASAIVKSVIELSLIAKVPEYYISFFGTSIGTSLPELAVDYAAIRSKKKELAIGDITGSCLVDATLSISSGPLIAPTIITAYLAVRGTFITMIIVAISTLVIVSRKKHDKRSGTFLLLLYLTAYFLLLLKTYPIPA